MLQFVGNVEYALDKLKSAKEIKNGFIPPPTPSGIPTQNAITNNPNRSVYAQSQVIYTQPQFYSPLHTPQNWQIPIRRRDIYQWIRHWVDNDGKIAGAIDFYSNFPVNGFETVCPDSSIKRYFDNLNKKLNLDYWCKLISREYHMLGDVFPFLEVQCDICHGSGIRPDGEFCEHKGGSFRRLVVLNPDTIEVQKSSLVEDPVISLMPDEELRRVVWNRKPKEIFDRLPIHIRQLVVANKPIPLAPECVSHLKYNAGPYQTYGTSIIKRLFRILAYKDKLLTAQWIIAERLILPIRVVKVGDADRPASNTDLAAIQQQLAQVANDPNLTLVTHHAFDYEWYGASGKVLPLSNEYELINKEMLQGLMLNEALLSGEMAGYASAAIGVECIIQRLEAWRLELARWIEDKIYRQVSKMKGFIDKQASEELGEEVYIVPKIQWNDLNLRDDTQQKQLWMQLYDKQLISAQTVSEKFGLDYDHEVIRRRYETAAQSMSQGGGGAMMGGPPGGGMELGGGGGAPPPGGEMGGMGAPPPGGEMGGLGAPPAGGAAPGAPPAPAGAPTAGIGTAGKIMRRGKKKTQVPEEEEVEPVGINLTSLEQIMYQIMMGVDVPFQKWIQYPLGPYKADFAIPQIKLAVECDGYKWHSTPDAMAHDQKRDSELAKFGWTTIRFSETELKENKEAVRKTLIENIYRLWKKALDAQKQMNAKNKEVTSQLKALAIKTGIEEDELLETEEREAVEMEAVAASEEAGDVNDG